MRGKQSAVSPHSGEGAPSVPERRRKGACKEPCWESNPPSPLILEKEPQAYPPRLRFFSFFCGKADNMWMKDVDYSGFVDNPHPIHRTSVYKSVDKVDNVGKSCTISSVNHLSIPEYRDCTKVLTMITNKEWIQYE
jgi:hypothetical protein